MDWIFLDLSIQQSLTGLYLTCLQLCWSKLSHKLMTASYELSQVKLAKTDYNSKCQHYYGSHSWSLCLCGLLLPLSGSIILWSLDCGCCCCSVSGFVWQSRQSLGYPVAASPLGHLPLPKESRGAAAVTATVTVCLPGQLRLTVCNLSSTAGCLF